MKISRKYNMIVVVMFLFCLFLQNSYAATTVRYDLNSNMISWWPLDGDANDKASNNNGLLQGGSYFVQGKIKQASNFDALNQYIRVPTSNNLNFTGSFTIDAWIFPKSDSFGHIVAKWGDSGDWTGQRSYSFVTLPGRVLRFAVTDAAHQDDISFHVFDSPAYTININEWNHVAAIYDQSTGTRKIYLNGAEVASRTDQPITVLNSIADLTIGGHQSSSTLYEYLFDGYIDEVEIYNKALPETDIRNLFLSGSSGKLFLKN